MSVPSGRLQFFALEAGDYLDRLTLIVARPAPPDPEEFVRLTRALRGASLMAGLSAFSGAASALEQIAKAHRSNQWSWTEEDTGLLGRSIVELKRLVERAEAWTDSDADAAAALASALLAALDRAGVPSAVPLRPASDELQTSVRAFVAREGASIAGTLEHAAQAIELGQPSEMAEVVLQRLQPLRGLAALPNLSPLPEFLDAIELTMRAVRDGAPPPSAPAALRAVAGAVANVAREIVDQGTAAVDAPAVVGAARALLHAFGREDDVIDVARLFVTGDPAPIVHRGTPRNARSEADPTIELVSLADRFRQAGDQLLVDGSSTARLLQLFALALEIRSLAVDATEERPALAPLFTALGRAIASGRAEAAPRRVADLLRDAADHLARAAEARNAVFLADDLAGIVTALELEGVAPAAAPPPPAPSPRPAAPPVDEGPIVPIESLAYDEPPVAEPVPIETLAPDTAVAGGLRPFELSFGTYHRLRVEAARPPARPVALEEPPIVPIDDLLYRGRRALERADVVRLQLSGALRARQSFDQIQPLVSELIDLVPLALAE
jgi:hypothetical protein